MKKMFYRKLSVTIGIAAYNAEKNIGTLLNSLTTQSETDFKLNKIIIHSDNSIDKTVQIVKRLRSKKIILIDNKKRRGFAGVVKFLIKKNNSDVLLLLNDDIVINDKNFVNKMISPFYKFDKVGLVCGHPTPFKPINFVQTAIQTGFNAFEKIRYDTKGGQNRMTCDGKTLALSKEYLTTLHLPEDKKLGNVDQYLYFKCITNGFMYRNVKNAIVYYRNPTTLNDFMKWSIRNQSNRVLLKEQLGDIVDVEYKMPRKFLYYKIIEFLKNPPAGIFTQIIGIYCEFKSRKINSKNFEPKWDVVSTTKDLN